ncbi:MULTISPECIES: CaiB/BaiF CoA-transferase family protein [unclassified Ruegeria]|uniref:CaiB/BaiF CoA transferase family protein n=1 Tax=unclassified Ruegeria TaxID=2625375 RepID=UPI0014878A72|nr:MULTISPECIES: CoA transferase [unclassified Ruegeria]
MQSDDLPRHGPLTGVRVVDLTAVVSGPMCTMILADQGADVIKIERADGDFTRHVATRRGGHSASYLNNNRNKRSVVADLKNPDDIAMIKQLVKDADVFIQNFRPGVMDRLGLSYEVLSAINPRLVYMSISGFGFDGPLSGKPVYDPLIQALSALTTVQAGSDEERPRLVRTILPDKLTAVQASQAVTAALFARERTGKGQKVTLSMLDTVAAFLWASDMNGHTFVGDEMEKEESQSFHDLIYEVKGGYLSISIMQNKHWEALAHATGRPDILEDERFKTTELRDINRDARLDLTQTIVREVDRDTLLAALEQAGVPCAPVLTRREMRQHPQLQANGTIVEYDHPSAGRLRQTRPAAMFHGTPATDLRPAPELGEHSDEIRALAGRSDLADAS